MTATLGKTTATECRLDEPDVEQVNFFFRFWAHVVNLNFVFFFVLFVAHANAIQSKMKCVCPFVNCRWARLPPESHWDLFIVSATEILHKDLKVCSQKHNSNETGHKQWIPSNVEPYLRNQIYAKFVWLIYAFAAKRWCVYLTHKNQVKFTQNVLFPRRKMILCCQNTSGQRRENE